MVDIAGSVKEALNSIGGRSALDDNVGADIFAGGRSSSSSEELRALCFWSSVPFGFTKQSEKETDFFFLLSSFLSYVLLVRRGMSGGAYKHVRPE